MGQAVFELRQFLCGYFRANLSGWLGQTSSPTLQHLVLVYLHDGSAFNSHVFVITLEFQGPYYYQELATAP